MIYSDVDPLAMAYSLEILGASPNVRYIYCDASEPEEMLNSRALAELFDVQRKVAITYMGISYFLPGVTVRRALRVLHDWAAPGSHLVLGFIASRAEEITLATRRMLDAYQAVLKVTLHLRMPDEVVSLAGKWRVCEPGVLPYDVYLGATDTESWHDPAIANIRGHVAFFER